MWVKSPQREVSASARAGAVVFLGSEMAIAKTASCFQGGVRFQDGTLQATAAFGTVTSVAFAAPAEVNVVGSPITTSGTITISWANESANKIFAGPITGAAATPSFRSLVTADLPAGTGTVTSVSLTAPAIFTVGGSPITTSGTFAISLATETANTVWAGPTTGAAATPTFRALVAADIAGLVSTAWSSLTAAASSLTLANAGNATTFNQTSAVTWKWANTTAATSSVSQSSPIFKIAGRYWTGAADAEDNWTLQALVANGTNAISKLQIVHSGSTGQASVEVPAGTAANPGLMFGGQNSGNGFFGVNTVVTGFSTSSASGGGINFFAAGTQFSKWVCDNANGVVFGAITSVSTGNKATIVARPPNTAVTSGIIQLGASASNNFGSTAAGAAVVVAIGGPAAGADGSAVFNPASGPTNFIGLNVNPTVNQTGTASGSYTGLQVNVVETALKGSSNLLIDLQAGASGGTSKFSITNGGHLKPVADVCGQATVTAGNTTKAVSFTVNYTGTGQPIIVITPTSDPLALGVAQGYWVTYSGSTGAWTGFTINIQGTLASDVVFNYIVMDNR